MLRNIASRVYYMPHVQETDRPTLGLICGDDYSVLVDSGNSPAHAKEFLKLVHSMHIAPVRFVIITHWHWDHIFGMKTMDLPAISHEDTKKRIQYLKTLKWDDASLDARVATGEEIEFCRDMIKREMPVRDHLELKSPDLTFDGSLELNLGGVTCIVEHVGGVHARDSSIVYIPEAKTMFLGDCIYQDFYSGDWSYDRQELGILLDKIRKYDAEWYLTGHQSPKSQADMWRLLDDLSRIGEIVGDETSLEQAAARFQEVRKEAPDEEQSEYIRNFVSGNQKKFLRSEAK